MTEEKCPAVLITSTRNWSDTGSASKYRGLRLSSPTDSATCLPGLRATEQHPDAGINSFFVVFSASPAEARVVVVALRSLSPPSGPEQAASGAAN